MKYPALQPDTLDLSEIRDLDGYVYVATPYSKYPGGLEAAFVEACRIGAWFVQQRIGVFVPIAHTHPIAVHGGIDPIDHRVWLPADWPMMDGAAALVVAMLPSWQDSFGISEEVAAFGLMEKPIFHMAWPRPLCERGEQ